MNRPRQGEVLVICPKCGVCCDVYKVAQVIYG
jgi:uncharacterized C2H2 Zn-finger protein